MYCQKCGKENTEDSEICNSCGAPITRKPLYREFTETAKARSKDAIEALKIFAINPVGGLSQAFENLGDKRAAGVGIVFAVFFDLCVIFGAYMILRKLGGWLGGLYSDYSGIQNYDYGGRSSFDIGEIFKLLITGVVPLVSIAASSKIARMVFRGRGSLSGDVFIAGASLLPLGILILLGGILGLRNIEVVIILTVYSLCYTVLMLYSGCTKISKIPDAGAALAVPIMLLLSIWLSKTIYTSIL